MIMVWLLNLIDGEDPDACDETCKPFPNPSPPSPESWRSGFRFILPVLLNPCVRTQGNHRAGASVLVGSPTGPSAWRRCFPSWWQVRSVGSNPRMATNLPPDFQYYTPEQQQQFTQAQQAGSSPLFTYRLPGGHPPGRHLDKLGAVGRDAPPGADPGWQPQLQR